MNNEIKQGGENVRQKSDKIVEVKNVTKVFDGITVVDDVNLSIRRGEFITLLGPSGCGKTTLLRMIAGFEIPTSGKIFLEHRDVTELPPHKRSINTVFQKYALFPHLNVYKNIAFGLKLKKLPNGFKTDKRGEFVLDKSGNKIKLTRKFTKDEIEEKVTRALRLVGLEAYGHRDVTSLSGGQQQRVAIARALVCEPKVLLLDEPLGALDLKMRKDMQIELKDMHKNLGITFIYVTHDQEEALTMSDNVVVINSGAIQQYGSPKKIYDEPSNAFVADFIGESNILSGVMKSDFNVNFCGTDFKCLDKGFEKNEKVDLVIRPEDIGIAVGGKGQLEGRVTQSIFKGTYYEMNVDVGDYEFTVQNTTEFNPGSSVSLTVNPDGIHIMKKLLTANEYKTELDGENSVKIGGGSFEFVNAEGLEKGDKVTARVDFDKVELTDDESDGIIGGNVVQTLYKGSYYQVQVYTDDDDYIYVDTADEWDLNDRVGILIKPENIVVARREEEAGDDTANGDALSAEDEMAATADSDREEAEEIES